MLVCVKTRLLFFPAEILSLSLGIAHRVPQDRSMAGDYGISALHVQRALRQQDERRACQKEAPASSCIEGADPRAGGAIVPEGPLLHRTNVRPW